MQSKETHESTRPRLQLSATQLIASVLAAITATIAASYLGVNGTVIGAGVASLLTVVGNAVYSHSIHKTGERVRTVAPSAARWIPTSAAVRADSASTTVLPRLDSAPSRAERTPPPISTWRRASFTAVGLFAAVLAVLTSVELVTGRPISDLLRGTSGSGTTVFGSTQATSGTSTPVPQVTVTQTVVPTVVTETPTITQTAPAVTVTPTSPTPTPATVTPTPTPTSPSVTTP
jgi:hypothetical protein